MHNTLSCEKEEEEEENKQAKGEERGPLGCLGTRSVHCANLDEAVQPPERFVRTESEERRFCVLCFVLWLEAKSAYISCLHEWGACPGADLETDDGNGDCGSSCRL